MNLNSLFAQIGNRYQQHYLDLAREAQEPRSQPAVADVPLGDSSIPRDEFVQFVEDFKSAALEMGGAKNAKPFLQYTDVVIKDDELPATVWCWWQAVGTELQGCALVKVGTEGVLHEKIAYFSSLPEKLA